MRSIRNIIWKTRREISRNIERYLWYIKRKILTLIRHNRPSLMGNSYRFSILCVKRIEYVDLVIDQVNSLHLYNPLHEFYIYCDNLCQEALDKYFKRFDYKNKIKILNIFNDAKKPWQNYKIDMIIMSAQNDSIVIDADTFWYSDIKIDKSKVIIFTEYKIFRENANESSLIKKLFNHEDWLDFMHYVSAFIYIPGHFMNDQLISDLRSFQESIMSDPLKFIESQSDRDEIKRLSEEISVCLALQKNINRNNIVCLKTDGSRKDKNIFKPLYFGSENRIMK